MDLALVAPIDPESPYGAYIRPYSFYKYMTRVGYKVDLLALRSPLKDRGAIFRIISTLIRRRHCKIMFSGLYSPLTLIFLFVVRIRNLLTRNANTLIVDFHGSASHEILSYGGTTGYLYYIVEFLVVRLSDIVIAASEELKRYLVSAFRISPQKVKVIENGARLSDTSTSYISSNFKQIRRELGLEGKKVILLVAPRNFYSNILAVKYAYQVMEELREVENIILLIVGGGKVIEPVPENVRYLGHVEDRLYHAILSLADVAIAPYPEKAVCGGARNKIFDYWSHKLLVVSTKEGMRGIAGAKPGTHFILSGYSVKEFAQAVLRSLEIGSDEKARIVNEAFKLVKDKYLWEYKAQELLSFISKDGTR